MCPGAFKSRLGARTSWLALAVVLLAACGDAGTTTRQPGGGSGSASVEAGTGGDGTSGSSASGGSAPSAGSAGSPTAGGGGTEAAAGSPGTIADSGAGGACDSAECNDQCPDDPDKTEPGVCGCGVPDVDTPQSASCQGLKDALVHRYTFDGVGSAFDDSVGGAHGTALDTNLSGNGLLTLDGMTYGALPAGVVSSLTDASFELWVNWTDGGGTMWQRVFDFGMSDLGSGMQGAGTQYLFLSTVKFRFCFRASAETPEVFVDAPVNLPSPATAHVVAIFDDTNDEMRLYLNGAHQGSVEVVDSLSMLNDENNWLGRSQYAVDPGFAGSIRELRIYDIALSEAQVQRSNQLGEEPEFLRD